MKILGATNQILQQSVTFLSRHSCLLVFCPPVQAGFAADWHEYFPWPSWCMSLLVLSNMSLSAEAQTKCTADSHNNIGNIISISNDIENNPRCTNCKYASKALVPALRLPAGSLRALLTGTWAYCKNGSVYGWWPWNQWFKQTTKLWSTMTMEQKRSKRNIIFRFLQRKVPLPSSIHFLGIQTVWVDPSVKHTWEAALRKVQIAEWMAQTCAEWLQNVGECVYPTWKHFQRRNKQVQEHNSDMHSLVFSVANAKWRCSLPDLKALGIWVVVHQTSRLTRP